MPIINSRCVTNKYCAGVINGYYFALLEENKNVPEDEPKITDFELSNIIII